METSRHEGPARTFYASYPAGTKITDRELLTWTADLKNGAAIKEALTFGDPKKQLQAIKRWLNEGGRSNNLPEAERFVLETEDAKTGTFVVRPYSDVMLEQAEEAPSESLRIAVGSLKKGMRAVNSLKLDELPQIAQDAAELALENITAMKAAVVPTYRQEFERIMVLRLTRGGIAPEMMPIFLKMAPQFLKDQKLLRSLDD